MTPQQLAELCDHRTANGAAHVYLTLQRDRLPKGQRVRLAPQGGPLGRIATVRDAGDHVAVVAVFDAAAVARFLRGRGLAA